MTQAHSFKPTTTTAPIAVLTVAMCSIQLGAVFAKQLFPAVGAVGATALRLGVASLMLTAAWRPWRMRPSWPEVRSLVVYGMAMGWMNFFFYSSIERIPLGIAVAVEFTGPLAVAAVASRRAVDFGWIAIAAWGLVAMLPRGSGPIAMSGVGFALAAGLCWALYIVFGQKAGNVHGGSTAAFGTLAGALLFVPLGFAHAGAGLLSPALLPCAAAVGLLSSALPYSLEMFALTRLPARTFGILMSVQPALGALSGAVFLGERLSALQWTGIASVMLASVGSASSVRRALPPLAD
ncbi:MAG: threonine/homoserine exporter RhtA [Steroidobacteraceae bacterium]